MRAKNGVWQDQEFNLLRFAARMYLISLAEHITATRLQPWASLSVAGLYE